MIKIRMIAQFLILSIILSSCGSSSVAVPSCPPEPLGVGRKVLIGNGDNSSIEVFAQTYAYTDPGETPWCDVSQLSITPLSATAASACVIAHATCLAQVNLGPDNIKILQPSGQIQYKPALSYDLDKHPPKTPDPECTKCTICFSFYRKSGTSWIWAGYANRTKIATTCFATGQINHLSEYALVEMVTPQNVISPHVFQLIVASEFLDDYSGGMGVAFQIRSDSEGVLIQGDELVFDFSPVDPGNLIGDVPKECQELPTIPEQFTCIFPIGSPVELILGVDDVEGLNQLINQNFGNGLQFYSAPIRIHN